MAYFKQRIAKRDVPVVLQLIPRNSIFTVIFTKKDGTERVMNCRRGVKSHLTPNPVRPRPQMPANEVTVFDLKADGYRMFNLDTVKEIKALGNDFIVRRRK